MKMATYAYVEEGRVQSLHDVLPENWKNVSNFQALANDESALNQHGWYTVVKPNVEFDQTEYVQGAPAYTFNDNTVIEERKLVFQGDIYGTRHVPMSDDPNVQKILKDIVWQQTRQTRDEKMKEFEWRYTRYFREQRVGRTTTDSLEALDNYMQQLADITTIYDHPEQVVWPVWDN